MRIAIFADNFYPELSGVADTVLVTGRELARRGHQIEYFVPAYHEKDYRIAQVTKKEIPNDPNIIVHRDWCFSYPTPTMQGKLYLPKPWRGFFNNTKFDIIHSNSFFGPGLDALCFSRVKSIPLVGTNHTLIEAFLSYSPINNAWVAKKINEFIIWYFNKCKFVSTPSVFLLEEMRKKGLISEGQFVTNPIENSFFKPRIEKENLKNELGLNDFTILFVGRLSDEKNPEVLLWAFMNFAKKYPKTTLVFVGEGALRKKMETLVRESEVGNRIKFRGPYSGETKQKLYDLFHASDVFVMTSPSETQSMCTTQAMAAGLPIIAANAGSLPELVSSDRGLLFKFDDSNELSQKIEELYLKSELRQKLGLNAKNFAQKYSVENVADEWEKIYNKVISEHEKKS